MLSQDPRATPVNHVTHTGEHGNEDEDKVNEPSSDLIQPTQASLRDISDFFTTYS